MHRFIVDEENDRLIDIAEKGMDSIAKAEGFFLVNAFPWLKYLPSWLPGAGFKKIASEGYERATAMCREPYELTKKKMVRAGCRNYAFLFLLFDGNFSAKG